MSAPKAGKTAKPHETKALAAFFRSAFRFFTLGLETGAIAVDELDALHSLPDAVLGRLIKNALRRALRKQEEMPAKRQTRAQLRRHLEAIGTRRRLVAKGDLVDAATMCQRLGLSRQSLNRSI